MIVLIDITGKQLYITKAGELLYDLKEQRFVESRLLTQA